MIVVYYCSDGSCLYGALARDKDGNQRRALALAEQAERLARTADEIRHALELQVLLHHEMGRHDLEVQRAAELRQVAPDDERTRTNLRRRLRDTLDGTKGENR